MFKSDIYNLNNTFIYPFKLIEILLNQKILQKSLLFNKVIKNIYIECREFPSIIIKTFVHE